jgi:hypothetical protein
MVVVVPRITILKTSAVLIKSRSNHNDASKSGSKTASQANNHVHHDSNGSDKANKSSPKGHSNDKRGDSFFGGDPFFSDSDDYD